MRADFRPTAVYLYRPLPMSDVTSILNALAHDDSHASGQLLPLVYDELRQLAARQNGA